MASKKVDPAELNLSSFTKWSKDWGLVTAADGEKVNTMTVAWGALGVLWSKNMVTVYVHPNRYTHEFMEKADKFSVTFFGDQRDPLIPDQREALNLLGSVSGRDRDKIAESGLTVEWQDGAPAFKEAALTITCRMVYREALRRENFVSEELSAECWGGGKDTPLHSMYIGEVIGVYVEE
ncbi:MAG: flavin reductase family protein [Acutalibacter sp.]|nr:flavin reductase family protein [Acutalibacter sp.]